MNTIFEDHPDLGLFLLPLLVWHPLQLLLGNLMLDRLTAWVRADPNQSPSRKGEAVGGGVVVADVEKGQQQCEETKSLDAVGEPTEEPAAAVV